MAHVVRLVLSKNIRWYSPAGIVTTCIPAWPLLLQWWHSTTTCFGFLAQEKELRVTLWASTARKSPIGPLVSHWVARGLWAQKRLKQWRLRTRWKLHRSWGNGASSSQNQGDFHGHLRGSAQVPSGDGRGNGASNSGLQGSSRGDIRVDLVVDLH